MEFAGIPPGTGFAPEGEETLRGRLGRLGRHKLGDDTLRRLLVKTKGELWGAAKSRGKRKRASESVRTKQAD